MGGIWFEEGCSSRQPFIYSFERVINDRLRRKVRKDAEVLEKRKTLTKRGLKQKDRSRFKILQSIQAPEARET